ncbi:MAG: xanthine dehydrogenase family protein molybdopterin-binding subunit [Pyrinomonadaceae bacterium]|nr:xanthine dehydrogenase family protein molybdopterin-binding subunit [Pyrinomonadaceae bacterium]
MSNEIGKPLSRLDGRPKVTGAARYTADTPIEGLTYAVFATSTIPHGRVTKLDVSKAEVAPGVLKVLTHLNTPKLKPIQHPPAGQSLMPLQDDRILYEGQPVALVVADTWERARHAADLVRVEYARAPFLMDFTEHLDKAVTVKGFFEPDSKTGDFDRAFNSAPVKLKQNYHLADRHHNAMEPHATIAAWRRGKLDMYDTVQGVFVARTVIAQALGRKPADVRVRSKYLGGGYGCKGFVWPHQILAAVAAREVRRPVKLVLTRAQDYTSHGYQAATEQTVTLAAGRDGQLVALRHESVAPGSMSDDYVEYGAIASRTMYACPALETRHRIVRVNRGPGTPMRAPQEGPSMFGLECAMDELAVVLKMDPVELRLKNYAERDPTKGKPFSSKKLRECYSEGAQRFGWERRNPKPGSMREGHDLIGWGMASALMETYRFPATARVTLERGGTVLIESGTQEIGTGVYTIMPQIAADVLGVAPERVRLVLGDTTLPGAGMTAGSSTTMGVGSAVHDAATKLKQKLTEMAGGPIAPDAYADLLKRRRLEKLSAEGLWKPDGEAGTGESKEWTMYTFGAVFVEVRVDESLRVPRLARCVGVYSAGRIINPKTARSQMTGGMIWGLGQALLEHTELELNYGRYVAKDLANYLVPVNADVPDLEAYFVDEVDEHASPIGAKGIGELGAVGVSAAIANAVYHATGVRVRDLPITVEKLL